jgi:hypothetical protein
LPKKELKTGTSVSLFPSDIKRINDLAEKYDISRSKMISMMIRFFDGNEIHLISEHFARDNDDI